MTLVMQMDGREIARRTMPYMPGIVHMKTAVLASMECPRCGGCSTRVELITRKRRLKHAAACCAGGSSMNRCWTIITGYRPRQHQGQTSRRLYRIRKTVD